MIRIESRKGSPDREGEAEEKLKKLSSHTPAYNLINTRQMALKTVANASYGYYGFAASQWYSKECAESITAFGRH
jgi:DNA polymerase elongation subunit (family B)